MANTPYISADALANQIVLAVEQEPNDVQKILGCMQQLAERLKNEKDVRRLQIRDDSFAVAEQHFIDMHDVRALMDLLRLKAVWSGDRVMYGAECEAVLLEAARDRTVKAKIRSVGFGKRHPTEAIKRLLYLLSLKVGMAVADKTWGYGTIREEDDYYKSLTVDFDNKPDHLHTMGFDYAADALQPIGEDHILAIRHRDGAAFDEACRKTPGVVVKDALRSYGPMTLVQLETVLTSGILPADLEWKAFWTHARAQLKDDPTVKLPAALKKTATLELIDAAATGDAEAGGERKAVLEKIVKSRDPLYILDLCASFTRMLDKEHPMTDEERVDLEDRFGFVFKAAVADSKKFGAEVKVRALLVAKEMGVLRVPAVIHATQDTVAEEEFVFAEPGVIDVEKSLCFRPIVLAASRRAPVSVLSALVHAVDFEKDEAVAADFVGALSEMNAALLERLAPAFLSGVAREAFLNGLAEEFAKSTPSLTLLRWTCRALASARTAKVLKDVVSPFAVVSFALASFEKKDIGGEDLRMRNDIRNLFLAGGRVVNGMQVGDGKKWLVPMMEKMSPEERATVYNRLVRVEGVWESVQKNDLTRTLVERWPELEIRETEEEEESEVGFYQENATSLRSYRERRAAYDKLMNEEFPQNRKDIELAKSFGDLSENFEYESARNTERALIARQARYEEDFRTVKELDFSTIPAQTGLIGMGSYVTVRDVETGAETAYAILGEWDSDPTLGILSCKTPVATALLDHRVGDEVVVRMGDMEKAMVVTAVAALPQAVLDWAK